MKHHGYTLTELLIYMVLAGLVISYSMQTLGNMSKNYVVSREVTKMQQTGRDAVNVLARDIANTGYKYYLNRDTIPSTSGGDSVIFEVKPSPLSEDSLFLLGSYASSYVDTVSGVLPSDSSASFFESSGAISDTLEVLRSKLVRADSIGFIERTKFFIQNDTLLRVSQVCTTKALVSGLIEWLSADTIAILENAKALQFQYSKDGYNWSHTPTADRIRDEIQHIRIELLVSSSRENSMNLGNRPVIVGDITVHSDGIHFYRKHEKIVTLQNNGILL